MSQPCPTRSSTNSHRKITSVNDSDAHRQALRKNQLAKIHQNFECELIEKQAKTARNHFEKQAVLFKNRYEKLHGGRRDRELEKYLGQLHLESRPQTAISEVSVDPCFERARKFDTGS